jgi:pimeloyl-ACP methyl ester carboxylesterase
MSAPRLQRTRVGELEIAYRELGSGPPVLLVHGWPTSSYLWRGLMPAIAEANRAIAIDLPGFGGSSKPTGVRYDFELFETAIDGLLEALGLDSVAIAVHDLGGPVGLHWAIGRPQRVERLAVLNTLVYPEFSEAVVQFIEACSNPEVRKVLTSPEGLEAAMRLGLADETKLTAEALAAVREPFETDDDRRALADAGIGLELEGFTEIAAGLGSLEVPVRVIYGERDRILPDVGETMARLAADLPQAEVTPLADCGHFLQEEEPELIGGLLARFLAGRPE